MARSLEHQTLTREIQITMARMLGDSAKPSQKGGKNRLLDAISPTEWEAIFDNRNKLRYQLTPATRHFDALAVMKVPQMIILHTKVTRTGGIEEIPEEFFAKLERSNDWNFKLAGLKRGELLATKTSFQNMTKALNGDIPTIWLLTGVSESLIKALKIKHYDDLNKEVKQWHGPASIEMRRSILFGSFSYLILKKYLEPTTLSELTGALKEDQYRMLGQGIELPTHLLDCIDHN